MPRRNNPDLPNQTSRDGAQVGFRLTPNEETALDRLVLHKRKTLASSGIPTALHGQLATRSMLIRTLIEEKAKELGVWPEQDAPVQATPVAEVQPVPSPVPAVDPRQLEIPGAALQPKPTEAPMPEPARPEAPVHESPKPNVEPAKPTKKAKPLDEAGLKARLKDVTSSDVQTIADELGVSESAVRGWRNAAKIPPGRFEMLDVALKNQGR